MRRKQRYKCTNCGHVFQNKSRGKKQKLDLLEELWNKYCFKRQTYQDLADEYKISLRKVQYLLDQYEFIPPQITPSSVVLIMDTTYF